MVVHGLVHDWNSLIVQELMIQFLEVFILQRSMNIMFDLVPQLHQAGIEFTAEDKRVFPERNSARNPNDLNGSFVG